VYEIEKKNNRYIVYRVVYGTHLRQGSFVTEEEALKKIEESRKIIG